MSAKDRATNDRRASLIDKVAFDVSKSLAKMAWKAYRIAKGYAAPTQVAGIFEILLAAHKRALVATVSANMKAVEAEALCKDLGQHLEHGIGFQNGFASSLAKMDRASGHVLVLLSKLGVRSARYQLKRYYTPALRQVVEEAKLIQRWTTRTRAKLDELSRAIEMPKTPEDFEGNVQVVSMSGARICHDSLVQSGKLDRLDELARLADEAIAMHQPWVDWLEASTQTPEPKH